MGFLSSMGPRLARRVADDRGDPRVSMAQAPRPLQWILTEITGKALPGQSPPFRWTAGGRVALTLGTLAIGLTLSWLALDGGLLWLPLLLPGWLLTVSAMRTWQTSFVHHASHNSLLRPEWLGKLLAELFSVMGWIQPLSGYAPEHRLHHGKTATTADADLRFLVDLGFRPGLAVDAYWRMFLTMLVSPWFHARYARYRLAANFFSAPRLRRLAAIAWTLSLLGLAWWSGQWFALIVIWLVPAWPLYQIAGLTQLLTEHNWVRVGDGVERPKVILGRLTHARFFGFHAPQQNAGWTEWAAWLGRMLLISLPERLIVAPGDLPNHDWHHRHTLGDWANSAYARRDDVETGSADWGPYTEFWGFRAAATATFQLLSSLPKDAVLGEPTTYVERGEQMLGM
jgi:fatty acid desaturase